MRELHLRIEIPMDAEDFFQLYISPEFRQFLVHRMGLARYEELEREETNGVIRRRVLVEPGTQIPRQFRLVAKKWLKNGRIQYHEHTLTDTNNRSAEWRIEPPVMKDQFDVHGTFAVEPQGKSQCLVLIDGQVESTVKMLGIGALIERISVHETRERYGKLGQVVAEWRKMQGLD